MLILLFGPPKSGKTVIKSFLINNKNFKEMEYTREIFSDLIKMQSWCENYVTILPSITESEFYKKRPCVRLVILFSPSNCLWRNANDDFFYECIYEYKECHWITNFGSIDDLHKNTEKLLEKIRPTWDQYFMKIAVCVSKRSNCMKGRVGCVIVKENRIIGTGYNGTPSKAVNCYENGCKRCNNGARNNVDLEYCFCIHAEENALLYLSYENVKGSFLYVTTFPCQLCCRKIIQMKIKKVVYGVKYSNSDIIVNDYLKNAGIELERVEI
ncbi:Deoxycytidine monophosphate (dCMP) deaminase [Gurleya vavrai]